MAISTAVRRTPAAPDRRHAAPRFADVKRTVAAGLLAACRRGGAGGGGGNGSDRGYRGNSEQGGVCGGSDVTSNPPPPYPPLRGSGGGRPRHGTMHHHSPRRPAAPALVAADRVQLWPRDPCRHGKQWGPAVGGGGAGAGRRTRVSRAVLGQRRRRPSSPRYLALCRRRSRRAGRAGLRAAAAAASLTLSPSPLRERRGRWCSASLPPPPPTLTSPPLLRSPRGHSRDNRAGRRRPRQWTAAPAAHSRRRGLEPAPMDAAASRDTVGAARRPWTGSPFLSRWHGSERPRLWGERPNHHCPPVKPQQCHT